MDTRAKHDRQQRKAGRRARRLEREEGRSWAGGRGDRRGGPDGADPAAALGALMEAMSSPQRFEDVRDLLVPMLPRRVPPPDFGQVNVTTVLPPGILVGFAIDSAKAYGIVHADVQREWGVDARTIALAAISNLRRRAEARDPRDVQEMDIGGLRVRALRPVEGWESALILAPDLLERFFGPEPVIVAAPLRPLVVAFDSDVDPLAVFAVVDGIASSDPRGLAIDPMRLENGHLTVLHVPGGDDPASARIRPGRTLPS